MPPISNIITTAVIYVQQRFFDHKMASNAHHAKTFTKNAVRFLKMT